MSNNYDIKSILIKASLMIVPPMIRETLFKDPEFRKEFEFLTADVDTVFNNVGVAFRRSEFYDAIRNFFVSASEEVTDRDGLKWIISAKDEELFTLALHRDKQRIPLREFALLSPDSTIRLRLFKEDVSIWNLPVDIKRTWLNILSERALKDDEFDMLLHEFRNTPAYMEKLICNEITRGECNISSLVPPSREYFERLVGTYDRNVSITDYAAGPAIKIFKQLSEWSSCTGFSFSLFVSSHSTLTSAIVTENISNKDLIDIYKSLEKYGDRLSQLGAIEVGLRILIERPAIQPFLIRLIEKIRDDNVDEESSQFQLLSVLFYFVDGELSRLRLLSDYPPFYRRLASLSQAALIQKQLLHLGTDIGLFIEKIHNIRIEHCYMQSFVDMRIEPHGNFNMGSASQMKEDCLGRIISAAKKYEINIKDKNLNDIISNMDRKFPPPYNVLLYSPLLGPSDETDHNLNLFSADRLKVIKKQLCARDVKLSSFAEFAVLAKIFRIDSDYMELVIKAMKRCDYRFADVEDRQELLGVLSGLATVAATTRNSALANNLRILVFRYCHDLQYPLLPEEAMGICLAAAASHAGIDDWRKFIGESITKLAFGKLEIDDGKVLYSHLQCLCHAVPELWISSGRANAALKAFITR